MALLYQEHRVPIKYILKSIQNTVNQALYRYCEKSPTDVTDYKKNTVKKVININPERQRNTYTRELYKLRKAYIRSNLLPSDLKLWQDCNTVQYTL